MTESVFNINPHALAHTEQELRNQRHVECYRFARNFCKGSVLDYECGCGYGSHLISLNPDVEWVLGYEPSLVQQYPDYHTEKVDFSHMLPKSRMDTLVALDVVEHLNDDSWIKFHEYAEKIDTLIFSFPRFKSKIHPDAIFHVYQDTHRLSLQENVADSTFMVLEGIE